MDRRQQIRFLRLEHLERPTHTTATVAIIWEAQKESIDYLEKSRGGWSGRGSCRRRGTSVAEAATRQKEEPGGGIKPAITSSDARTVHNYTTTQRCSADVSRKLIHRLNVDDNLGLLYAFTCKLI